MFWSVSLPELALKKNVNKRASTHPVIYVFLRIELLVECRVANVFIEIITKAISA